MSDSTVATVKNKPATQQTKALALPDVATIMQSIITKGDLATLQPNERVDYYLALCDSIKLNPLSLPFLYLELGTGKDRKTVLYATKGATDQIRQLYSVDTKVVSRETIEDIYLVTVRVTLPDGRTDESSGAVPLIKENGTWEKTSDGKPFFKGDGTYSPLNPLERANAIMKAETKAKRRATLAAIGLPIVDETEIDTIPKARRVDINPTTGEYGAFNRPADPDAGDVIEGVGHVVETTAKAEPKRESSVTVENADEAIATLRLVASGRGLGPDNLDSVVYFKFPAFRRADQLTKQMATDLAQAIETADEFDLTEWGRDYFREIEDCDNVADLKDKIGYAMKEAGMSGNTHRELYDAFVAKGKALRAQESAAEAVAV